jgi:hypothetical protein
MDRSSTSIPLVMSTAVITLTPQFVPGRPLQQHCYTEIYKYLSRRARLFTIRAIPFPRRQPSSFWARLDPAPFSLPCNHACSGAFCKVQFFAPPPPSTLGHRSVPLLLDSPRSCQTYLSPLVLGYLRWRKTSITFSTTTFSRLPATVVLSSSRYLYLSAVLPPHYRVPLVPRCMPHIIHAQVFL